MESFSSITFRPDRVLDLVCNLQNFSKVNHIIFVNLKFRPDFSFSKNLKMFLLRFANIQKKNTKISWRYKFREFSELFPRLFRIILRQLFLLGYFFYVFEESWVPTTFYINANILTDFEKTEILAHMVAPVPCLTSILIYLKVANPLLRALFLNYNLLYLFVITFAVPYSCYRNVGFKKTLSKYI